MVVSPTSTYIVPLLLSTISSFRQFWMRKRALLRLKRQEASSERESLDDDDVKRNADLRNFNHEVAQR